MFRRPDGLAITLLSLVWAMGGAGGFVVSVATGESGRALLFAFSLACGVGVWLGWRWVREAVVTTSGLAIGAGLVLMVVKGWTAAGVTRIAAIAITGWVAYRWDPGCRACQAPDPERIGPRCAKCGRILVRGDD